MTIRPHASLRCLYLVLVELKPTHMMLIKVSGLNGGEGRREGRRRRAAGRREGEAERPWRSSGEVGPGTIERSAASLQASNKRRRRQKASPATGWRPPKLDPGHLRTNNQWIFFSCTFASLFCLNSFVGGVVSNRNPT